MDERRGPFFSTRVQGKKTSTLKNVKPSTDVDLPVFLPFSSQLYGVQIIQALSTRALYSIKKKVPTYIKKVLQFYVFDGGVEAVATSDD